MNNYKQAYDESIKYIKSIRTEMGLMQESILKNAQDLDAIFSKVSNNKLEKDIKAVNEQLVKMKLNEDKLKSSSVKLQKEQERLSGIKILNAKKEIDLENKQISLQAKKESLSKRAIAQKEKETKASLELNRAYVKLVAQQKEAKKELQDLIVSQGKNTSQTRKAQKEYDRLSKKVNQANGATRNFAKGGLVSSVKGIRNLLGAFGLIGGVQLFASAIKDTFNRVRDFDKSMQNLAGVFRTTREELKPLEADIIRVAGESIKTSREVATLAESLATLGKSPDEIRKLLKPIVDLGIGLNTSSELAGEFLVQMLNAFGGSNDEAMKYADTIATIRTSTTLDFQKMRDSFQYLAPISKLLNEDLAYTGAVIGIIADNGLKAQQAGRVLGTSLQKLAKQGMSLTDALDQITEASENGSEGVELLSLASTLLGAEGAKLGVILAKNTELIELSSTAIRENSGALKDLVEQQLESLDAKLLVLDASWEELILNIENGRGGIATTFTGFIEYVTSAIQWLSKLEKAQSDVFELGVEKSWVDIAKRWGLKEFLFFIETGYEKATKAQEEFNNGVEILNSKGIVALNWELMNLNKELENNNDLGDKTKVVYENQIKTITDLIELKTKERDRLAKISIALGHDSSARNLSTEELKKYINQSKISNKQSIIEQENLDRLNAKWKLLKAEKEALGIIDKNDEEQQIKNTELNKEIIKTVKDLSISKQNLLKLNKKVTGDRDKDLKLIDVLNTKLEKLKKQRDSLGDGSTVLVKNKKEWDDVTKSIKETESAIKSLTGKTKKKDPEPLVSYLKNTLAFYQAQISFAKDQLKNKAQTKEEFEEAELSISKAEDALDAFIRKLKGIKKKGDITGVDLTPKGLETDLTNNDSDSLKKEIIAQEEILANMDKKDVRILTQIQLIKRLKKNLEELPENKLIISDDNIVKFDEIIDRVEQLKALKGIFSDVTDTFSDIFDIDVSKFDFIFDSLGDKTDELFSKDKIGAWADLSKELIGSVLDASLQRYDIELQTAQRNRDLILNNDLESDEAKEAARAKYDEKEREINTRKAKEERKNALIKIAVDTAVGVTKAVAASPLTGGLPFSAIMASIGLAQAAIVASQPLPQFETGGTMGEDGWAITQEKRPEPIVDKKGNLKTMGSYGGDSLTYLQQGDRVFKSREDFLKEFDIDNINRVVFDLNLQGAKSSLNENRVDGALLREISGLRNDMGKMGVRIEKISKRPLKVNNIVELKDQRAY